MDIEIVQKGHPVLRQIAHEVKPEEIGAKELSAIIERMKTALDAQEDGLAIAAPQIGESLRIFVVSGKVFSGLLDTGDASHVKAKPDMVFINPVLTKLSKTKKKMSEGCLSVRTYYGNVTRSTKATVRALDEKGNAFERGGSGILAQIFQHEVDHLNGVLFIDKAEDIEIDEHYKEHLRK